MITLEIHEGDVLVFTRPQHFSSKSRHKVIEKLGGFLPDVKAIMLVVPDGGADLAVLRGTQ